MEIKDYDLHKRCSDLIIAGRELITYIVEEYEEPCQVGRVHFCFAMRYFLNVLSSHLSLEYRAALHGNEVTIADDQGWQRVVQDLFSALSSYIEETQIMEENSKGLARHIQRRWDDLDQYAMRRVSDLFRARFQQMDRFVVVPERDVPSDPEELPF